MIKIFTVCPQGLGSSLIAKINVEKALTKMGVEGEVETAGVTSITGQTFDLIVTVPEMADSLERYKDRLVFVTNFLNVTRLPILWKQNSARWAWLNKPSID